jgi:hypothetical protein
MNNSNKEGVALLIIICSIVLVCIDKILKVRYNGGQYEKEKIRTIFRSD